MVIKENGSMTTNLATESIQAKKPFFSVIIPVRSPTEYLKENLQVLKKHQDLEIIVVTDKESKTPSPAKKRNLAAAKARGDILVFLDDDSYPSKEYFKEAKKIFLSGTAVACGPQLTPKTDNSKQIASGLVLSSFLGSGGAGTYRNQISKKRYVNDYPSVNLVINKALFYKIGGFDESYWPGEDTLFCRKILKTGYKILYTPKLVVYHHRREMGLSFLQQQSRFGLHRGYFFKKYPENSRSIGYIIPSLFFLYIFISPFFPYFLYIYLLLLFLQFLVFIFKKNHLVSCILATIFIPITHLTYGFYFLVGLLKKDLKLYSKTIDQSGNYNQG